MRNIREVQLDNEQISVADSSLLDMGDSSNFTLVAWVKFNGDVPTTELIKKADATEEPITGYLLGVDASDKPYFLIADGTDDDIITADEAIREDEYNLLVAVCDRDTPAIKLYVNGVEGATAVEPSNIDTLDNSASLLLTDSNFDGSLGEVQIIKDYCLTDAEVLELYTRGTSKGLKATYGGGDVKFWARWKNRVLKDNSGYEHEMSGITSVNRKRISEYR